MFFKEGLPGANNFSGDTKTVTYTFVLQNNTFSYTKQCGKQLEIGQRIDVELER